MAEKLAWDFHSKLPEFERFELVTINPGLILGPVLIKAPFESGEIIYKMMMGKFPGVANIMLPVVDVRDVALSHLRAVDCKPNVRILVNESTIKFMNIGTCLYEEFGQYKYRVCWNELMYSVFKVASFFMKEAANI